jgi:hypothetical protein
MLLWKKKEKTPDTFACHQGASLSYTKRAYAIIPEKRWRLK